MKTEKVRGKYNCLIKLRSKPKSAEIVFFNYFYLFIFIINNINVIFSAMKTRKVKVSEREKGMNKWKKEWINERMKGEGYSWVNE